MIPQSKQDNLRKTVWPRWKGKVGLSTQERRRDKWEQVRAVRVMRVGGGEDGHTHQAHPSVEVRTCWLQLNAKPTSL